MSEVSDQGAETPIKLAACCIPLVGIILYFVWKDSRPQASSDVCKFALIGFGINFGLNIVVMLISMMAQM